MGRILKSGNINLQGLLKLDGVQVGLGRPKTKDASAVKPQACIVENSSDFAVIEITCSCGAKTHLRCNYTAGESPLGGAADKTK